MEAPTETSDNQPSIISVQEQDIPDKFKSLKHQLLGPSLTKAGQDTVDQLKVSEIIYNASKGSKFFNNEESRDRNLTEKIQRILARKEQLLKLDLSHDLRRADEYIASLELGRDLTQTIVHMDCDAFYAAVEELDRPELRDVPMAVGKGVLTTCNYHARKFGCRSGMAGFVAMKLCPQLICLPLNFDKYSAKADEVRNVLRNYDPRFESASMDEAYLNITRYCEEHEMDPESVVHQLRQEVFEECKITVSAGIASNAKLAKIGSNKNKPNGQFRLAADRSSIMAFMRELPVRKVNGVGRVFERELDAIGIETCGDIYAQRAVLTKLFGEKAFQFLIQCYLGLGRTQVAPSEETERKSVGTESTFHEMEGKEPIREKLRHIAESLEEDMTRTEYKGRTLVLKVKLHTYEVLTRQTIPPHPVTKADELYRYALPMLVKLEKEMPRLRLRLLGLRCTNLVSTAKTDVDFFGLQRKTSRGTSDQRQAVATDADGWEIWPEAEFEEAAERERQEDMAEMERLSQEQAQAQDRNYLPSALPIKERSASPKEQFWDCPVCQRPRPADEKLLNEHVDLCLSRQTIRDVIKDSAEVEESTSDFERTSVVSHLNASSKQPLRQDLNGKKRGRPAASDKSDMQRNGKRKAFFS
ncbi:DNA/RNA polymerase [Tothia fuscella]|uniref:DNA polymerase kappa n=1 Tax=Tothia fuscella TaxID=1048955 RepID=A0A9P4NMK8_9PEZI|nr:DNA/RNA polymerase [Tothia fuscella]